VGVDAQGYIRLRGLFSAAQVTANVKAAVVPFPDGSKRVLYCMKSPDHWFEDFGTAKLKRGRATVKLDADVAKVIKRGDYRVFVTPEGDCRGLSVRRKRAASFEVRELMGGRSSIAFSYRIVGRRKTSAVTSASPNSTCRHPFLSRPHARRARLPRQH
jgi:hypothetical protein